MNPSFLDSVNAMAAGSTDDGDTALIAAAQRGERSALDAFVRRHDRWVRHVVYATVSDPIGLDDIVQRVWSNVWQQIGTLTDRERWRGWLYRLAKNAAIDVGIKNARERRLRVTYYSDPSAGSQSDPAERLARAEEHRRVLSAVKGLPAIYREPFVLRHLQDWSYAQIAEALGLPEDTVETRLVRARRLLRQALNGEGPRDRTAAEVAKVQ